MCHQVMRQQRLGGWVGLEQAGRCGSGAARAVTAPSVTTPNVIRTCRARRSAIPHSCLHTSREAGQSSLPGTNVTRQFIHYA